MPGWVIFAKQALECYKIEEAKQEDDELREFQIPEIEGERVIERPEINPDYTKPLKTRKANISTKEVPKFTFIVDYWYEETVGRVIDFMHEYRDLFLTMFTRMKIIAGELGEMMIPLKPDVKLVRQRPYKLNPKYKEKVKVEIAKMLEA